MDEYIEKQTIIEKETFESVMAPPLTKNLSNVSKQVNFTSQDYFDTLSPEEVDEQYQLFYLINSSKQP